MAEPGKTTGRRRLKISYRVSLLVAIPALVLFLSGLIIYQSYASASRETKELAYSLFRDLSLQAFERTREHLASAPQTMVILQGLSDQGRLSDDQRSLAAEILPLLRAQPDYSWVSYSSEAGAFTGAYRASDGSYMTNFSYLEGGKTKMEEYSVSPEGVWTKLRQSDDYGYDPRKRPFYERAARQKTGVWTPPYVFFGQGIPGITYAAPRKDRQGRMTGVFSVDFDLNRLSGLTRQAVIAGAGTIFMFTPDGTILAHPDLKLVELDESHEGRLLRLSDVRDPVLRAYAAAVRQANLSPGSLGEVRRLNFDVDRVPYLGAGGAYRINDEFTIIVGLTAPASAFLGPVQENLLSSARIALLVLGAGFALAVLFANKVARPILEVTDEMDRVGRFDLRDTPVDRSIFKEIDRMERSLEGMIHGLRSFSAYVPRDLVQELVTTGQVARIEGQTRRMTLLFSDVAGFTSLAEQLSPNELVALLGGYLSEVATIVTAGGGTVDKFLGDGVMAFWNAPKHQPDHATLAVRAALGVHRRLRELRTSEAPELSRRALPTRIGLATGDLVVGNIGTPDRMNYTVMGDTANLASRLESLNKVYGTSILVTEETARGAAEAVLFRPVDLVNVTGKLQAVKVFEPLGERESPEADTQAALAQITEQAFRAYLEGKPEAAVGLYREAIRLNERDPVATVMAERCEDFLKNGIPEGWSGATRMRHK